MNKKCEHNGVLSRLLSENHQKILKQMYHLYESLFLHDGYGEMKIEIRLLKKGQKEVIIHCGKQYRYVVDFVNQPGGPAEQPGCSKNM